MTTTTTTTTSEVFEPDEEAPPDFVPEPAAEEAPPDPAPEPTAEERAAAQFKSDKARHGWFKLARCYYNWVGEAEYASVVFTHRKECIGRGAEFKFGPRDWIKKCKRANALKIHAETVAKRVFDYGLLALTRALGQPPPQHAVTANRGRAINRGWAVAGFWHDRFVPDPDVPRWTSYTYTDP